MSSQSCSERVASSSACTVEGKTERPAILFAGGGTGGHVFPLVAVADAVRAEADVDVVFVGTARGMESRVVPARGDKLELFDLAPIKGKGIGGAALGLVKAFSALPNAHSLLKRIQPSAVLSIGGYAAGPIGVAAWLRRIPVAVMEPNSVLGLANRWLLPLAKRVYVAFPDLERGVGSRALLAGVPLRQGFRPIPYEPQAGRLRVLVLGGSQGAAALNDVLPGALADARQKIGRLEVVHQAGRDRDEAVRRRYEEHGGQGWAEVTAFMDDVAAQIARADLVIQRSGASAIAELCAVGRASILVPFPAAADDHQRKNAQALDALGGAVCVVQQEATRDRLASLVVELADNANKRVAMAQCSAEQGRPAAARDVALDLLSLAGIPRRKGAESVHARQEVAHV